MDSLLPVILVIQKCLYLNSCSVRIYLQLFVWGACLIYVICFFFVLCRSTQLGSVFVLFFFVITGYFHGGVNIWTVYFRSYWSYKNAFIWTKYVIIYNIIDRKEMRFTRSFPYRGSYCPGQNGPRLRLRPIWKCPYINLYLSYMYSIYHIDDTRGCEHMDSLLPVILVIQKCLYLN
jgi:hypothetical protein